MVKIKEVAGLLVPLTIALFWFVIYPILNSKAVSNCQAINEGRRLNASNWEITRTFIEQAAKRVDKQAMAEAKQGKFNQAVIDWNSAARYRSLKSQINTLPQRDC